MIGRRDFRAVACFWFCVVVLLHARSSAKQSSLLLSDVRLPSLSPDPTRIRLPRTLLLRGGATKRESRRKGKDKAVIDEDKPSSRTGSTIDDALDALDDAAVDTGISDDDMLDMELGDGEGNPMLASVTDMWNKTPPMTQVYLFGTLFISLVSFALNKNQWPEILHFDWKAIATGQLWRLFTAFLYFGPVGLNYILTLQFVWQYMSHLEKMSYNKPEDFLMMMIFGASALIGSYSVLGISMKFLGHNLAAYLVYIWSRLFEGTDVSVMDLVTVKSELIPWFFAAQTLILDGEIPYADLLGIAVGHMYIYLKQKGILKAPSAIKQWFSSDDISRRYAKFKDDFE